MSKSIRVTLALGRDLCGDIEYSLADGDAIITRTRNTFLCRGWELLSSGEIMSDFCRKYWESMTGIKLDMWTAQCATITPIKTGFTFRLIGKPFDIE